MIHDVIRENPLLPRRTIREALVDAVAQRDCGVTRRSTFLQSLSGRNVATHMTFALGTNGSNRSYETTMNQPGGGSPTHVTRSIGRVQSWLVVACQADLG